MELRPICPPVGVAPPRARRLAWLVAVAGAVALGCPLVSTDPAGAAPPSTAMYPTSGPAVVVVGGTELAVWRGSDGAAWTASGVAPAPGTAQSLGGTIVGAPGLATNSAGQAAMVARGGDDAGWVRFRDASGNWTPWRSLGGGLKHAPTIVSWGPGRYDIIAVGLDNAVWHIGTANSGASWSSWWSLGGVATSSPDAASQSQNTLDVVVRGADQAVWHRAWNGARWTDWSSLGGVADSAPALAAPALGRLFVLARGGDGATYWRAYQSGWTSWARRDGQFADDPDATAAGGVVHINALGLDGRLWSARSNTGWWVRTWAQAAALVDPSAEEASATPVSSTEIDLRWTAPTDPLRSRYDILVELADVTPSSNVGVQTACASCTSIRVGGLLPGRRYSFRITSVDHLGRASAPIWAAATTPATAIPCDAALMICVSVNATQVGAPLSHVASGYNLGFTGLTHPSVISPLAPRSWRISPLDRWALTYVRSLGSSVSVLLSNGYAVGNWDAATNRVVRNPWQNWDGYRQYVVDTVRWHMANNLLPDEWEIQNEPDMGYYGAASPATRALILEQFRVAHDAIRSVLPDAAIVGPTLGAFTVRNSAMLLDMTSFLDYAVANNLRFDTIDWHELGTMQFGDADADPSAIVAHAQTVRDLLAARPSLGSPRLRISEYTAPWYQSEPGATVRYFAALEQAGISSAQHSCYPVAERNASGQTTWHDTCTSHPGLINGLRTSLGGTRSDYWTHATYAAMNGTTLATTSNHTWVAALTTVAADGTITALIGRAHGCNPSLQYRCPVGLDATTAAQLLLRTGGNGTPSSYRAVVQRIPNVGGAIAGPILVSDTRITAAQGSLTVPVTGGLADGDALVITLQPA